MSTGYTHKVGNGKVTDLKEFALICARAFGAAMHQRDDDADTPIKTVESTDYHQENINKNENQVVWWGGVSDDGVFEIMKQEHEKSLEYNKKTFMENLQSIARYKKMLRDVEEWKEPTPEHKNLKDFMIEQLQTSMEHDNMQDYYMEALEELTTNPPRKENIKSYRAKQIESLNSAIERDEERVLKDQKRCDDNNEWIEKLYESF